ncbi:MAG: hypothetical protein JEY94_02825 [Melioribacteraceae bacterium]|nr:hypothetical protein [Melioribacteraceae bacterium]
MAKKNHSVKTIEVIENLLMEDYLGVLAYIDEDSFVVQVVVPFIFFEKNIYILIKKNEEKLNLHSENKKISFVSFNDLNSKFENEVNKMAFKYLEIYLTGFLKHVKDQKKLKKFCEEFKRKYYSLSNNESKEICDFKEVSIYMIDTEEIHAAEVTGGLH